MTLEARTRFWRKSHSRTAQSPHRRVFACRRASVGLEFAAVAVPFFLLVCGTVELGLLAVNGAVLDGATREAARQIRTGQAQQSADPLATFRNRLCAEVSGMVDCSRITFDVRSFPSFSSVSVPPLYDENGNLQPTTFDAGQSSEVVVVRTTMRWDFVTPLLSQVVGNGRNLTASFVFRNEPFKGPT
jgi:Flp pilus assembly protein TadG